MIVSIAEARYLDGYHVWLKFNTGESGEVDLREPVFRHKVAESLRDAVAFSRFYLDSWPTLAWECGFDLSPEFLYERLTGKPPEWSRRVG